MISPLDIGRAVRTARKAMGLRQDALAAAAGVGLRFVTELERGKPTAELGRTLAVLAAAGLDVQIVARSSATMAP